MSTLNYATRASYIANAPTKNIDPKIKEIQELKRKNKLLQEELANANKHIEFLTSLTTEQLKRFGGELMTDEFDTGDAVPATIDTSSPVKAREKALTINPPIVPKVTKTTSVGVSMGTSSPNVATRGGMSTQTDSKLFVPGLKPTRSKSKDPYLVVEKRESIEDIALRKQFEEKMKMISTEINFMSKSRDDTTGRFSDVMKIVTDLLKVNQVLRDEINAQHQNVELYELKEENEDLRDRIELLETIVQSDSETFQKYVSSHLFDEAKRNQMGEYIGYDEGCVQIDSIYVELMELRKIVKKLEKRNKHLERQNMENQYQMHFIGNNEPSRPIIKEKCKLF